MECPVRTLLGDNLRDRDNLSTKDKRPVSGVSVIRRFTYVRLLPCVLLTLAAKLCTISAQGKRLLIT